KTLRDGGAGVLALLDEIEKEALQAGDKTKTAQLAQLAAALCGAVASARLAVLHLVASGKNNKLREASAVSVPYLMMLGWLCGGWGVLKSAVAAESQAGSADWDKTFLDSKFVLAGLYATHHLPQVIQNAQVIQTGGEAVETLSPDML
ncbi:MAG: acyl-CoA dehydrogenase C-terminal domain-containing protein, partial [Proteobacteria bacterium]|nr:acyl-CoA dehydrogenase C-terminal domain-containing protein [Pseudomonadota bacterium]